MQESNKIGRGLAQTAVMSSDHVVVAPPLLGHRSDQVTEPGMHHLPPPPSLKLRAWTVLLLPFLYEAKLFLSNFFLIFLVRLLGNSRIFFFFFFLILFIYLLLLFCFVLFFWFLFCFVFI